jgi:T-complex protein 1 subunit beta
MALKEAKAALERGAVDHSDDEEEFRKDLFKIAKTTLSSKIVRNSHDKFANLAVDAIMRVRKSGDLELIQVLKKSGGSMSDSFLEEGFILDKKIGVGQPRRVENATIMVANTPMDTDKIKIYGAKVRADAVSKVAEIEQAEIAKMMKKCEKIAAHGINCFINRQLIYNKPEQYFASKKIMAIEHADFDGIERLAMALGAEIVSTFDSPGTVRLGRCDLIEEILIGEDRMIRFSGCHAPEACTIVMRGSSQHLLDEAERSLHDALCVLLTTTKDPRIVYGGGCTEVAMAEAVDLLAKRTPGKKALAIEAFARALRSIPKIIADNGGYDSADLVAELRAAHLDSSSTAGLDMVNGTIGDMKELGVTESYRSKLQVLVSAVEAAEMIVRCDEVIRAAPREREQAHPH